jgi:hypothetical protein
VPCRAHHVRAENPTFLECAFDVRVDGTVLQAKTKSPLRSRVLLRLNSTHPADDVRGSSEPRSRDVLIQESSPGDRGEFSFHFEWSTFAISTQILMITSIICSTQPGGIR